jgi:hypothetical protein
VAQAAGRFCLRTIADSAILAKSAVAS